MFSMRLRRSWFAIACWFAGATIIAPGVVTVQGSSSDELDGELSPQSFYARLVSGDYDVVVDVRRRLDEWNVGHIAGATLVESLASYTQDNSSAIATGSPTDLAGCEYCDIIVYCRSGNRAGQAITLLRQHGFKGRLWNGMGVLQWQEAGYELVNTTESVVPLCTVNDTVSDECYDKFLSYQSSSAARFGRNSVPVSCWWFLVGSMICLLYQGCVVVAQPRRQAM